MKRSTEHGLAMILCLVFGFILPLGAILWIAAIAFGVESERAWRREQRADETE
jgi:hypothetical protein